MGHRLPVVALLLSPTLALFARAQTTTPADDVGVIKTTVRRVVLDVVVSDKQGAPVAGLNPRDFTVTEDGVPQHVISFDANGFSPEMDYTPTPLPPQPPGTFINMPTTPEKGPLYILLYDLVNMDNFDQMTTEDDHTAQGRARSAMMKFIRELPEGSRCAIYVRAESLHLVQGFTSDKTLLYAAIDPKHPKPHVPVIFLMGANYGRGDQASALNTLYTIVSQVDGLPGRKNLIWFASQFPVALHPGGTEQVDLHDETQDTIDLLSRNQIAVYPVDARGVPIQDTHALLGDSARSDTVAAAGSVSGSAPNGGTGAVGSSPHATGSAVQGGSSLLTSYSVMDQFAEDTGGRAFYSDNDLAAQLLSALKVGGVYYTLTYASTNHDYDGKIRRIQVKLDRKGDTLDYRRFYYGGDGPKAGLAAVTYTAPVTPGVPGSADSALGVHRVVMDRLSANMQYGAPMAHDILFIVQAHDVGAPVMATTEQMAQLATEPYYFKSRRHKAIPKPVPPVPLQKQVYNFNIPVRQFTGESSLDLEVAAAAFDSDGKMMNGIVNLAKKDLQTGDPATAKAPPFFRVVQELEVPKGATTLRVAIRDTTNDRTGSLEIHLPLPATKP